jgi:hypothetical protein
MENLEEKGLQTLYLVFDFASWTADDGGRDIKSPIFLLPLSFKVKTVHRAVCVEVES